MTVFEIKSESCRGFKVCGEFFFFLDEFKVVSQLKMQKDSHQLVEINQLHMKEKDRPNFITNPYPNMIVNERYIIVDSKIFYLYEDQPLDAGILDMEELAEIPDYENKAIKKFASGPHTFKGSD